MMRSMSDKELMDPVELAKAQEALRDADAEVQDAARKAGAALTDWLAQPHVQVQFARLRSVLQGIKSKRA